MDIVTKIDKKNKFKRISLLMAILFLVLSTVSWYALNNLFAPLNANSQEEFKIIINPGSSTSSIAEKLSEELVIDNPRVFKLYVKLKGLDGKLKAGEYILGPSMDLEKITQKLLKGHVVRYSFTIPEGYTIQQIAQLLISKGYVNEEKFWDIVQNEPFAEFEFLKDATDEDKRLEGYLFPDTYYITKGMTEKQIIGMMLKHFQEVYNELPANKSKLNVRDTVILASIVELEAKVDRDRPLIASVFLNRLQINMILQADATLQYAFPERKTRVLFADLELDSPYNTYRNAGLPPTPIGSPGKSALEAVHNPADTDYLYFLAKKDGTGEHVFSRTLAEHNQNRKKWGY